MSAHTRLKILIVDDSRSARFAVNRMLQPYNAEVSEATSGAEAMAAIEKQRPDAILLDHVMPDRDGLDTLSDIRQQEAYKDLPIYICSSHDGENFLTEARERGATDLLTKPPDAGHLQRIMSELKARVSGAAPAPATAPEPLTTPAPKSVTPPVTPPPRSSEPLGAETIQAPPEPMRASLQPHTHSVRREQAAGADAPGLRALGARVTRLEESTASLAANLKKAIDRLDLQERALNKVTDRVLDELIRALTELREKRK